MPATHVLVEHEGQWRVAELLRQYRLDGRWRVFVRYTTAPGFQYMQARWADECRPVDEGAKAGGPASSAHLHAGC
jgi:hypothetical protein